MLSVTTFYVWPDNGLIWSLSTNIFAGLVIGVVLVIYSNLRDTSMNSINTRLDSYKKIKTSFTKFGYYKLMYDGLKTANILNNQLYIEVKKALESLQVALYSASIKGLDKSDALHKCLADINDQIIKLSTFIVDSNNIKTVIHKSRIETLDHFFEKNRDVINQLSEYIHDNVELNQQKITSIEQSLF
jgi:hypothetical protein